MSAKQVIVEEKVYQGFREFKEMVGSLLNPKKDPEKVRLRQTVQAYREMLIESIDGARDHPELLALALLGQVKFNGGCPTTAWLDKLPTSWIAIAPHLKCGEKAKALVDRCKQKVYDRQLLCQAASIVFLYSNRKEIEVVPAEGEVLGGDTYRDELDREEGVIYDN